VELPAAGETPSAFGPDCRDRRDLVSLVTDPGDLTSWLTFMGFRTRGVVARVLSFMRPPSCVSVESALSESWAYIAVLRRGLLGVDVWAGGIVVL